MIGECKTSESMDKLNREAPAPLRSTGLRFSLRSLLIGMMLLCAILAVLVPWIQHQRRWAHQYTCQLRMRGIASALRVYCDVHKSFPCASRMPTTEHPYIAGVA